MQLKLGQRLEFGAAITGANKGLRGADNIININSILVYKTYIAIVEIKT